MAHVEGTASLTRGLPLFHPRAGIGRLGSWQGNARAAAKGSQGVSEVVQLYRIIVPVPSIEAAAKFYAQIFAIPGERVSPGRHYFDAGGAIIALYDPLADGDPPGGGWRYHPSQYLYFAVADLYRVQARFEAAGGVVTDPIATQPWGETLFYGRDPFGTLTAFVDDNTVFRGGGYYR